MGKDSQLQQQPGDADGSGREAWRRGQWWRLSPLVNPVTPPLEWVEPVLVRGLRTMADQSPCLPWRACAR